MNRLAMVVLLFCAALAAGVAAPTRKPIEDRAIADPYAVVRGMTISCHGAGQSWGTDAMVETMAELKAMGLNWVTIHPYAGIRGDGTVGGSRLRGLYADPTWLTRPIQEAHRLGLKIMIKPHIAYWGSPFSWRGAITFTTDEQWRRFFDTYEQWITMVASLSAEADAFVVGTELDQTIQYEAQWRRIIAAVREQTVAPLTYSANWDQFERIMFWDALDVIGIQSYFPLVDHERLPEPGELAAAWARLLDHQDAISGAHNRKIVLAELGYNRTSTAAVRPWESGQGGDRAEEVQRQCLTAALSAIDQSDVVVGAFLWKWFPGETRRGNFLMSTPAMREVINAQWGDE